MNTTTLHRIGIVLVALAAAGVTQEPQWTLRGRVTAQETGAPLAGCTVTITGHQATGYALHWAWMDWVDPAPLTTGADGRFEVKLPAQPGRGLHDGYPSRVHVQVRADARAEMFAMTSLSRFFAEPVQDVGDIAMPVGRVVTACVVDSTGKPQEGVRVTLSREGTLGASSWAQAITYHVGRSQRDGRVAFDAPLVDGSYRIEVDGREVRQPGSLEVAAGGAHEVRVEVTPAEVMVTSGRFVDDAGRPLQNRAVAAVVRDPQERVLAAARTDANGAFRLVAVAHGLAPEFTLRVGSPEFYLRDDLQTAPWGKDLGDLVQPAGVPAKFRVVAPANVKVERVAVHLVPRGPRQVPPGQDSIRAIVPCVDGAATVEGVPHGDYSVRLHAIGTGLWPSAWQSCEVVAGAAAIEVALPELAERPVLLFTDEGQPVESAALELILAPGQRVRSQEAQAAVRRVGNPFAMTGSCPSELNLASVAAPVRTDTQGRATLRAICHPGPAALRVRGPFVVATVLNLDGFAGDTKPLELRVRAAGVVTAACEDEALRVLRDASSEKERKDAARFGQGHDPWGSSLGDLWQRSAMGLQLRPLAPGGASYFAPCTGARELRWESVEPGEYEVCLLLRKPEGHQYASEVVEPPLARIVVKAREETRVAVKLQEEHRKRLQ